MTEASGFQDQPQIERIRERLWNGREFGRAAVMVSSGFSRNAERRSASDPLFPLLSELASAMHAALYPPLSSGESARGDGATGAMRLATEYETVFGRSALDDLIVRLIPDASYDPGRLHRDLLALPWSDVFTTNYDTLLERARASVYDRKYDVVLTVNDVPAQTRPRVVKLHGSFPSHRPFIITEEDFRTYPTTFAPFVNMVQQSAMENVLCLIGFSGDDPNFLSWTGWVRDNLGVAAPPIYLVGVLDLINTQRCLLRSRNVVPVDLSPLFPTDTWFVRDERHAAGLEWFLENLKEGEQPSVMDWPIPRNVLREARNERLPDVPSGPRPISDPGPLSPADRATSAEHVNLDEMRELSRVWRRQRLEYPGWVVAPASNRDGLWRHTEQWVDHVLWAVERLDPPGNLFLIHEFNWRLERSLVPLITAWIEKIEQILDAFNPYPNLVEVESATIMPTEALHAGLEWDHIAECWVDLAFAIVRVAREDQEADRFRLWIDRLREIVRQREEWLARRLYEECLFHLSRFDQELTRTTLEDWPESNRLPFWQLKRASILAELAEVKEAEMIAGQALNEIRSRQRPYFPDLDLLSQEGWALMLLEALKQDRLLEDAAQGRLEDGSIEATDEYLASYRGRREELERHRCNPVSEIGKLEARLVGPAPHLREPDGVTRGFDPGRESVTFSLFTSSMSSGINQARPAFAVLKMLEDGGAPPRCGSIDMFPDTARTAAEWIEPHSPLWSLTSVIRAASEESAYSWFDRVSVATMPEDRLNHLFDVFLVALTQSINRLIGGSEVVGLRSTFSLRQVNMMTELLSRLSIRCSADQLATLFDLATTMYELPLFQRNHLLHKPLSSLFDRLLSQAMPQSAILQNVPKLLALQIPGEGGFRVSVPELWPEPFDFVDQDTKLEDDFNRSSWSAPIANLLRIIRHGEPEARKRASMRLARLNEMGGLNDELGRDFGEALWAKVDPDTDRPTDTSFVHDDFMRLPEPEPGKSEQSFKRLMLARNFRRMVTRFSDSDGNERISFSHSLSRDPFAERLLSGTVPLLVESEELQRRFVDWSLEEAVAFLHKMVDFWDDEKEAMRPRLLSEGYSSVAPDLAWRYGDWVQVMSVIVLPRIANADERTRETATRLLAELEDAGVVVLAALPMLHFVLPSLEEEVVQKMKKGLIATDGELVRGAVEGLYRWLAHGIRESIVTPPEHLLGELINRAVGRRQPRLDLVLARLGDLVEKMPQVLSDEQIDALCLSLENLIEETKLPEYEDRRGSGQITAPIPVDQRPSHRAMAARLASGLHAALTRRNTRIPQILDEWRLAAASDSLPEVRRSWTPSP